VAPGFSQEGIDEFIPTTLLKLNYQALVYAFACATGRPDDF